MLDYFQIKGGKMIKKLAIVVLNYYNYELTIQAVKQALEYYPKNYYCIVDNNSPNGSYSIIKKEYENIENVYVVKNRKNKGYALGNNFGVRTALSLWPKIGYVAIMNPDVIIDSDTKLEKMLYLLEEDEQLATIAPLMIYNQKIIPELLAVKRINNIQFVYNYFAIFKNINPNLYRRYNINKHYLSYVDALPGSFFIIKIGAFKEVGFFDKHTFLYCEERILGVKLSKKKYRSAIYWKGFFIHDHTDKDSEPFQNKFRHFLFWLKSYHYFLSKYLNINITLLKILSIFVIPLKIIEIVAIKFIKERI